MAKGKADDSAALSALWRAIFLVSLPFGVLSFALPIYGKELKASALDIGVLFSAVSLVPVFVRPFLGRILDRWGRRPFLFCGLASYAVSMILLCLARSMLVLTIARFIQGIGQAFLWMSAYAIVADLAHEDRGWSFGTIDEATNRGALLGALPGLVGIGAMQLAGYTLIQVWPLLFGLYAVSAVAGLVLAARRIGETCHPKEFNAEARHPEPLQLFALMVIVLITGASTAMVWPIIVIFLQDNIGATAPILAAAYLPAALISSFLPAQLGKLTDHFGRKPLMAGGLVIGAVTSAFIPHLRSAIPLALLWAVDSLGYAASAPAERAFVADIAGVDTRGMSYGLYTFAFFLGAAFGPLAGGWLYDNMGHAAPFYANAIMLMIAAVLVFALLREPKAAAGKNARRSPR